MQSFESELRDSTEYYLWQTEMRDRDAAIRKEQVKLLAQTSISATQTGWSGRLSDAAGASYFADNLHDKNLYKQGLPSFAVQYFALILCNGRHVCTNTKKGEAVWQSSTATDLLSDYML